MAAAPIDSTSSVPNTVFKSDITQVYELAKKHNFPVDFEELQEWGPSHKRTFMIKIHVERLTGVGQGQTKKEAKARAASDVLEHLKALPLPPNQRPPENAARTPVHLDPKTYAMDMNPCAVLSEVVQERGIEFPEYRLLEHSSMARGRLFFKMEVTLGQHRAEGTGSNKKSAKHAAAAKMLDLLRVPRYNPYRRSQYHNPETETEDELESSVQPEPNSFRPEGTTYYFQDQYLYENHLKRLIQQRLRTRLNNYLERKGLSPYFSAVVMVRRVST